MASGAAESIDVEAVEHEEDGEENVHNASNKVEPNYLSLQRSLMYLRLGQLVERQTEAIPMTDDSM